MAAHRGHGTLHAQQQVCGSLGMAAHGTPGPPSTGRQGSGDGSTQHNVHMGVLSTTSAGDVVHAPSTRHHADQGIPAASTGHTPHASIHTPGITEHWPNQCQARHHAHHSQHCVCQHQPQGAHQAQCLCTAEHTSHRAARLQTYPHPPTQHAQATARHQAPWASTHHHRAHWHRALRTARKAGTGVVITWLLRTTQAGHCCSFVRGLQCYPTAVPICSVFLCNLRLDLGLWHCDALHGPMVRNAACLFPQVTFSMALAPYKPPDQLKTCAGLSRTARGKEGGNSAPNLQFLDASW